MKHNNKMAPEKAILKMRLSLEAMGAHLQRMEESAAGYRQLLEHPDADRLCIHANAIIQHHISHRITELQQLLDRLTPQD